MKNKDYSIGLDLGTNSVGWAVVDKDYNLLKYKGKHMWGSRIFEASNSTAATRRFRSSRRRLERRKERIRLLRMLFEQSVLKEDDGFFIRLEESFLHNVSSDPIHGRQNKYNLFEGLYTDRDYYKKYPTIYHLRDDLMTNTKKMDPRLIYLAMHHIIKYRGNFLFEGENINAGNSIIDGLTELFESIEGRLEEENINLDYKSIIAKIKDILLNNSIPVSFGKNVSAEYKKNNKTKEQLIVKLFEETYLASDKSDVADKKELPKIKSFAKDLTNAITGRTFVLQNILFETVSDENPKIEINFVEHDDEKIEGTMAGREDDYYLVERLRSIHYGVRFNEILKEEKTISKAMIAIYEKHKQDLKILKKLFPKKDDEQRKEYYNIFRKNNAKNYSSYIKSTQIGEKSKKTSRKEFYEVITPLVEKLENSEDREYVLLEINNDTFLPKINDVRNAAIPYQFNLKELKEIIDKQKKYYPELEKNAEKILSIMSFKRPYSVGVLYSNKGKSKFSWADEIIKERVYPWNFNELVDIDKMAENFIERMTNFCNYFKDEKVLPLNSIYYQKYIVLEELNKIKILDKPISNDLKVKIFDELFCKKKTVTKKALQIFLKKIFGIEVDVEEITGLSDNSKFNGQMSSLADFKRIFGDEFSLNDIELYERAIKILTLFNDMDIKKRQLAKQCNFSQEKIDKLAKISYSGWGRFSKKLLYGIVDKRGRTILEEMYDGRTERHENPTIFQLLYDDSLGFKTQVFVEKKKIDKFSYKEHIKNLYCSPAVKRQIWQALKVVEEIVKIMGYDPIGVFLEDTKSKEASKKSKSRTERLKELYKSITKDSDTEEYINQRAIDEINSIVEEKGAIKKEKMFLYLLQLGKCMYTGENINLDYLENYEIDHIIPRAYIRDNSFENKVLVKKIENQNRSDSLGISKEIIERQTGFWKFLYDRKLIGNKKYYNLQKSEYTESDLYGFISRQLVETSQTTKAVKYLLEMRFDSDNTRVQPIRAKLVSELRHQQEEVGQLQFIKLRNLNYMHHAKDAYLVATIGMFTTFTFPSWGKEERLLNASHTLKRIKDEFKTGNYSREKKYNEIVNKRYSLIVDIMKRGVRDDFIEVEEGELINLRFNNLLKTMNYNDCLLSKKIEKKANANFYDQTIYPKKRGLIPKKYLKDWNGQLLPLSTELYGGYSSEQIDYMVVVKYEEKSKAKQTTKYFLERVPVLVSYQEKTNPGAVLSYLEKKHKMENPQIIRRVYKGQLIKTEGHYVTIASDKEVTNAVQLVMPVKYSPLIKHAEKLNKVKKEEKEKYVVDKPETINKLADQFILDYCEKIKKLYPYYIKIADKILKFYNDKSDSDSYNKLQLFEKIDFISKLLIITFPDARRVDNMPKEYNIGSDLGRLKKRVNLDNVEEWIYKSYTGLYELVVKTQ